MTITVLTLYLFYRYGQAYRARRVTTGYIILMFITTCVCFATVAFQMHSLFVTTEEDLIFERQDHDTVATVKAVANASVLAQFLLSDGIAVSQVDGISDPVMFTKLFITALQSLRDIQG